MLPGPSGAIAQAKHPRPAQRLTLLVVFMQKAAASACTAWGLGVPCEALLSPCPFMRCHKPDVRIPPLGSSGRDAPASTAWVRDHALEAARQAMQHTLQGLQGCDVARMTLRLRYATNAEALWYLRPDLQALVAQHCGASVAAERVGALAPLFQPLLPRGPQPCSIPRRKL